MAAALPGFDPADLSPGDLRARGYDWSGVRVHRIHSVEDPWFERAYACLWAEFGERAEMEQRSVIESRLRWRPSEPFAGHALRYEMVAIERGGELIAVRDHSAILRPAEAGRRSRPAVVVHLSHSFVAPEHRRSGIAGWLRALPLATARECAALAGAGPPSSIDLVAEMEPVDPPGSRRLLAYGRAGFRKIDPGEIAYLQPDFRSTAEIDRSGLSPLRLVLVVRRCGVEAEPTLPAAEVRAIVSSLYLMYGLELREIDMRPLWQHLETLPAGDRPIRLLDPAGPPGSTP